MGITCYYDENTWVNLFVGYEDDYFVQVKEHIGLETICHEKITIKAEQGMEIVLRVKTDYLRRAFSVVTDGKERNVKTLENVYYLCDEGIRMGKRFTGAMVGMYAYAGETELYAEFNDFQYQTL